MTTAWVPMGNVPKKPAIERCPCGCLLRKGPQGILYCHSCYFTHGELWELIEGQYVQTGKKL